jgi:hypothetical protein
VEEQKALGFKTDGHHGSSAYNIMQTDATGSGRDSGVADPQTNPELTVTIS